MFLTLLQAKSELFAVLILAVGGPSGVDASQVFVFSLDSFRSLWKAKYR
jgi:hypothetical protein